MVSKFGLWLWEMAPRLSRRAAPRSAGMSEPVGAAMIGFGGLLAVLAAWRFHVVNRQIEAAKGKVDRGLMVMITVAIAALPTLMMAYVELTPARS